uniref:HTH Mu-type domain-containing protein n=1 Tax=Cryptococcus bacillisporus CA1280 TaxID=1296109 RepID=A0A0D0VN42_CRYGA|nr:hypothetical protein I312_02957 [Cryptococcus bacillisporus CA1280]
MAPRIGRGLYWHLRCLPTTQRLAVRSHALVTTTRSFDKVTPTASVKPKPKLIKTKTRLSDMPAIKLGPDGLPQKALEAWDDTDISCKRSKSKTIRSSAKTAKGAKAPSDGVSSPVITCSKAEIEHLQDAIQQGIIPDTPLAHEVYLNWKRFPDCILLTRVGKFYESYFEPARYLASILSLSLAEKKYGANEAKRSYPFAGFPVPALDKYLKILVQDFGHTVVLVEEYDTDGAVAHTGKKLTAGSGPKERRVYRVVTPGTMVDESWMATDQSRYLLAIAIGNQGKNGLELSLAYTDASTGEFFTKDTTVAQMEDELARITPREVVLDNSLYELWRNHYNCSEMKFNGASQVEELLALLRVLGVRVSFADPCRPPPLYTSASSPTLHPTTPEEYAAALLQHHLQYALRESMPALRRPHKQSNSAFMQIDAATLQALEIRHAFRPGGLIATGETQTNSSPLSAKGTLLSVVSNTITSSGHRLLIRTLTAPSTSPDIINSRLALVQAFVDREDLKTELRHELKELADIMRIIQRFRSQRGTGRDIWDVGRWIRGAQRILETIKEEIRHEVGRNTKKTVRESESITRLQAFVDSFRDLDRVASKIESSVDESAIMFRFDDEKSVLDEQEAGDALLANQASPKGNETEEKQRIKREREEKEMSEWWIRPQFSPALERRHDELNALKAEAQKLQVSLIKKYDTPTLTIEKNHRFSYHIQMSAKDAEKVAKARSLERIGSTTGKTAYFAHGPLAELGTRIEIMIEYLGAAQRRAARELQTMVVEQSDAIQHNSELVDELDLSLSFAQNAVEMNWVKPILDNSTELQIINGRHPSVESSLLSASRNFTPNSTHMTSDTHLHVITGPNQGGKSTLLRQTAVIAILAQSGSFVPADYVKMGIVDRVFSRVGARDDLWRDRSTFMLEMVDLLLMGRNRTAGILRHATEKSLVIMDEIGRGTTLQAGVSIAYATLDYILENIKCRTLFATHYHELGQMLGYNIKRAKGEVIKGRSGIAFWCTDVDEADGAFSYSYKLRPGINYNSHAIKAASIAGMPESFLRVAESTLIALQSKSMSVLSPSSH